MAPLLADLNLMSQCRQSRLGLATSRNAAACGRSFSGGIVLGLVLLASGCVETPEETATEASAAPIGKWVSDVDGLLLDLQERGSFTVTPPAPRQPVNGSWTLDGDKIEFQNDADAAVCAEVIGIYRWSLSDGQLDFSLVEDDCEPRAAHMAGAFQPASSAE